MFSTHGKASMISLSAKEKESFINGEVIEHSNTLEGHRTFTSFAPKQFLEKLFKSKSKIVYFKEGERKKWGLEKDFWIIKTNELL